MKDVNFNIPKPRDWVEYKLYATAKISSQGFDPKNDEEKKVTDEIISRVWNIYFWNVFNHRAKFLDNSRFTIKLSRMNFDRVKK